MHHAGWSDIWNLALACFGAETIETRLAIGLIVAFLMLMVVEGLRVSFLPARRPTRVAEPAQVKQAVEPFRPRPAIEARRPKRNKMVNRHRAERPKIRRPAPKVRFGARFEP